MSKKEKIYIQKLENQTLTLLLKLPYYMDQFGHELNLKAKQEHIEEQKKIDPNYVAYDFAHYIFNDNGFVFKCLNRIVSTEGDVYRHTKKGWKKCKPQISGLKYYKISFPVRSSGMVKLHRMVCTTFLLKPERHKDIEYNELQVNHIDGDKFNNKLNNFEWVTAKENIGHAIATELKTITKGLEDARTKPIIAEVVKYLPLKGYKFIMAGEKAFLDLGLFQYQATKNARTNNGTRYCCKWRFATKKEIDTLPMGFPEELLEYLRECRRNKKKINR